MSIDVGTITNSNPNPQLDRRPLGGPPAAAPSRVNAIGLPVGGTAPSKTAFELSEAAPAVIGALGGALLGGHAGGLKDAIIQARGLGARNAKSELAKGIAGALVGATIGGGLGEVGRRAMVLAPVVRIAADMVARKFESRPKPAVSPRETPSEE